MLPAGSGGEVSVIAAVRAQVAAAAIAGMTSAAGQAPSNVTIVPTAVTATDGSDSLTMRVYATFSMPVNTTTRVTVTDFLAYPEAATAAAIKSASGGRGVFAAAAALKNAVGMAAASTAAIISGETLSGDPPATRASHVAAAAANALTAAGRSDAAALVNATSLLPTGSAVAGEPTVGDISGIGVELHESGGVAGVASGEGGMTTTPEFVTSGLGFAAATALSIFLAWNYSLRNKNISSLLPSQTNTVSTANPLAALRNKNSSLLPSQTKTVSTANPLAANSPNRRPQPPTGKPPTSGVTIARESFVQAVAKQQRRLSIGGASI